MRDLNLECKCFGSNPVVLTQKQSVRHLETYKEIDNFNAMQYEKDLMKRTRITSAGGKQTLAERI